MSLPPLWDVLLSGSIAGEMVGNRLRLAKSRQSGIVAIINMQMQKIELAREKSDGFEF
jgi:hypothetical protein